MFLKLVLTGTAFAVLALAQRGGGGGDMGGDSSGGGGAAGGMSGATGGGGGMGARAQKPTKAEQMADRLKLNKDQKSEYQTILESAVKDADPVVQQLTQARIVLANALLMEKSPAEREQAVKAFADAQFVMTGVEVRTFQKIVGLLKPNQAAKAPEAFDLMADIFVPHSTGGGRGGGGRGGGGRGGGGGGMGSSGGR
jgi:hypothetical protein